MKVERESTTNVPSIHAVGDVTNHINLTPVAIREGHLLADRLFGGGTAPINHDMSRSAVFRTPEIGTVGLTEARRSIACGTVDIYRDHFKPMKATPAGSARAHDHEADRRGPKAIASSARI